MAIRRVKFVSQLIHLVQKFRAKEFFGSTSVLSLNWFAVTSNNLFQLLLCSIHNRIEQLLWKLIFISVGEPSSTVVDRRT